MILKNNLTIERATASDLPVLVELLGELFTIEKDFTFNPKKHEMGLIMLLTNPNALIIVAKFEEETVAMVTMQTIVSTAMGTTVGLIEDFVVKEGFQDMGIGSHLFNHLKGFAKEHGLERMQLVCDNDNINAKEFYTKKAFKKSNLSAWYYH